MAVSFDKNLVETRQGILIPVHVIPGSKKFAVLGIKEWTGLNVRLESKPENGKANQELVKRMRQLFNAEVELAQGKESRQKKLLVKAGKEKVLQCLSGKGFP